MGRFRQPVSSKLQPILGHLRAVQSLRDCFVSAKSHSPSHTDLTAFWMHNVYAGAILCRDTLRLQLMFILANVDERR